MLDGAVLGGAGCWMLDAGAGLVLDGVGGCWVDWAGVSVDWVKKDAGRICECWNLGKKTGLKNFRGGGGPQKPPGGKPLFKQTNLLGQQRKNPGENFDFKKFGAQKILKTGGP